ncbi:MAG: hypothetical protein A2925_03035 [Candidatus Yanofskybacteria bacterium RIFCSPLOWO2_01_FULL_44_22]|uniref:Uncharacterized protein n=1 Tax=Candidatus Yanofskybacteria bacterium RIFCSPLOWO2_01_FULL_44_22 TaxID=1802697 RepID=A0A1F8GIG3_9BACT|nr:MAG: hypothetical protein A2659_04665 [Candidatus Yanofskybacteria bacterium RIFCSPHIGHO2_01_FULL_44_24]OGN25185.1 MAG: hypothetical protein A2925_03035 [Candidatus Yanofskybacteria bacterium RIFCSPLOWO2_01_FULL_44_22]
MSKKVLIDIVLSVLLFLTASFVSYFMTADAPAYDGSQVMGFPLGFYFYGGLCPDGGVCRSFSIANFAVDLFGAFIVVSGITYFIRWLRSLRLR